MGLQAKWSALLYVARCGTLSGAATELKLDATTVGRRIKLLEAEYGRALFAKNGRTHLPTAFCKDILVNLESAATSIQSAQRKLADGSAEKTWGNLKISARPYISDHILAPALPDLLKKRQLRVELLPQSSSLALSQGAVDLAIKIDDLPKGITWDVKRVDAEPIGKLTYSVYFCRDQNPTTLPWVALNEVPEMRTGTAMMDKLAGKAGVQIRVRHFEAMAQILASGLTKGLLPDCVARRHPLLVPATGALLAQPIVALSRRNEAHSGSLERCKNWAKDALLREL